MRSFAPFRYGSIRFKLNLLVLLNASFALVVAALLLFSYQNIESRREAVRNLSTQAAIIADSSTAALSFSDIRAASETLNSLRGDSNLDGAAIYDLKNRFFTGYRRRGWNNPYPAIHADGIWFDDRNLHIARPIMLSGERIGTLVLSSNRAEINAAASRYIVIVCTVVLLSLALALLLNNTMQRRITQPITALGDVARHVSATRDYSLRAQRHGDDEIGFLVDSFNEMLAQIELRDVASRRSAEQLRESEERYALAARGANDGLWDWKLTTGEIYFSARWNQMLGYPDNETWTTPEDWFGRIHHADLDRVRAEIAAHRRGNSPEFVSEYRMRQKNGSYIWVLSRGIAVRDASGVAIRMAGSQTDVTEGKIADPLTGLPNRLYFLDRLESAIETARIQNTFFAVLFVDLDRFKLVNDSLGHSAGDQLLEEIAMRLRSTLLTSTPASGTGSPSVVARLGGDEFGLLLNNISRPVMATLLAEQILAHLSAPFQISEHQIFVGASIGIAMNSSGKTAAELLRNADTAMYHAKTTGRARFELFDDGMRTRAIARLELESALRKVSESGQLVLYYQPQVSIQEKRLIGWEALIRWRHPELGFLQPADFIPVAEETDAIRPIGLWVLREACTRVAAWQREFQLVPPPTIAVNVSFKQLTANDFVEDVTRVLAETNLLPGTLKLEITESVVMSDPEQTIDALRRLGEAGVGLEIDDFGTGYSSLSYLRRLPFETLKIDRSFISELGKSEESGEIVRTILQLARSMGLDAVAEGVETAEQLRILSALGCPRAQGFLFSAPVEAEAVPQLLRLEALKRALEVASSPAPTDHAGQIA